MAATDSLGTLFTTRFFVIPGYQRLYDWGNPQVAALLADLYEHFELSDGESYLLNTILIHTEGDQAEVIDGQQRLTTLFLFFAACRAHGAAHLQPTRLRTLEGLLGVADGDHVRARLTDQYASGDTHDFLRTLAEGQVPDVHDRSSTAYPLCRSYSQITTWLEDKFPASDAEFPDRFWEFADHVRKNVVVAVLDVASRAGAWQAFERANDRGKPLSGSDLLKGDLFNHAADDTEREAVAVEWKRLLDALRGADRTDPDVFLHHYVLAEIASSKVSKARARQELKSALQRGSLRADAVARDLAEAAEAYTAILAGTHPGSGAQCAALRDMRDTPRLKRFQQSRPLLLAARDLPVGAFDVIACAAEDVAVVMAICEERGQHYEGALFDAAKQLRAARQPTMTEAAGADFVSGTLRPFLDAYAGRFASALAGATVAGLNADFARYLLFRVENHLQSVAEPAHTRVAVAGTKTGVAVEHIFPASAPRQATEELGCARERALQLVDLLGNRTLWESSTNSGNGALTYIDKRGDYSTSRFLMTKALAGGLAARGGQRRIVGLVSEAEVWDEAALLAHHYELAALLCETVAFPRPHHYDADEVIAAKSSIPHGLPTTFGKADHLLGTLLGIDAGMRTPVDLIPALQGVNTSGVPTQALAGLRFLDLAQQDAGRGSPWSLTESGQVLAASGDPADELAAHVLDDARLERVVQLGAQEVDESMPDTLVRSVQLLLAWARDRLAD